MLRTLRILLMEPNMNEENHHISLQISALFFNYVSFLSVLYKYNSHWPFLVVFFSINFMRRNKIVHFMRRNKLVNKQGSFFKEIIHVAKFKGVHIKTKSFYYFGGGIKKTLILIVLFLHLGKKTNCIFLRCFLL